MYLYVNIPFLLSLPYTHHCVRNSLHKKKWSTSGTLGKVRHGSWDAGNGKRMDPVKSKHGRRFSEMISPKSLLESSIFFSPLLSDGCPSFQLSLFLSFFLDNNQLICFSWHSWYILHLKTTIESLTPSPLTSQQLSLRELEKRELEIRESLYLLHLNSLFF